MFVGLLVVPRNMLRKHLHVGVGSAEIKNTSKTILVTRRKNCVVSFLANAIMACTRLFILKNRLSEFLGCRKFLVFPLKLWEFNSPTFLYNDASFVKNLFLADGLANKDIGLYQRDDRSWHNLGIFEQRTECNGNGRTNLLPWP